MYHISFIKSLMEFDKRVLYQGTPRNGIVYDMKSLKEILFFNEVFMSNTNEIFEKHRTTEILDDYVKCLNKYISNVSMIIQHAISVKRELFFTRQDSFERRFAINTTLENQVITQYYPDIRMFNYPFESGQLYYIGIKDNCISVSHVDPKREVYNNPITYQNGEQLIVYKTDDCIRDFIKSDLDLEDVVAVKVTTALKNPTIVTKVEYNGPTETMKRVAAIFGRSCLMISNPFIYTGDISQMIGRYIQNKEKETQKIQNINMLDIINEDKLIQFPNDSFDDYLSFLKSAVDNKETKKIYLTLYRIGKDPSIFYVLKEAIEKGIKVYVNIELFATGEKINKLWMNELKNLGVKVYTFEAGRLKVHAKLTLVKFNNGNSIVQIGTGNYHTKTTSQYTDLSLMTADPDICRQVEKLFNLLSKNAEEYEEFSNDLLVTRYNARDRLIQLIKEETDKEEDGYICIKCNALDDEEIISYLNRAAIAGCNIDLIIRGVCTWIPEEINDNVKIKSVVWDKLEHSRLYAFGRMNPTIYIGSLDLVSNKLNKRIETLVRIKDPNVLIEICNYLNRYITSTEGSWKMIRGGKYIKED